MDYCPTCGATLCDCGLSGADIEWLDELSAAVAAEVADLNSPEATE